MKIQEKAMLVNLSVSAWTGRTRDKYVSDEVAASKGAEQDSGAWWTYLVPKKNTLAIESMVSKCRVAHAKLTMPWMDGGLRILPSAMFMQYSEMMRKVIDEYYKVVEDFVEQYPSIVATASKRLGKLATNNHFPSTQEVKSRFKISVDVLPIPDAGDFRVQLDDPTIDKEEIKKNITESIQKSTKYAMTDLWRRLGELVSKVEKTLSQPDKIFRDTLITNLLDFCEQVPKMNVIEDEELEKIRQDIITKLSSVQPDDLREDEKARKKTADDTKDVLEKMKGYFSI